MFHLRSSRKTTFCDAAAVRKLDILEIVRPTEVRSKISFADALDYLFGPAFECAMAIGPMFGDLGEMSCFAQSNAAASAAIKVTNKI